MHLPTSIMKHVKDNVHQLSDVVVLNLVHITLWLLPVYKALEMQEFLYLLIGSNVLALVLYITRSAQQMNRSWGYGRHLVEAVRFTGAQLVVIFAIDVLFFEGFYSFVLATFSAVLLLFTGVSRIALTMVLRIIRKKGYNYRRVVVVGDGSLVDRFSEEMKLKSHYGYKMLASFNEGLEYSSPYNEGEEASTDIYDFLIDSNIDEVFISIRIAPEKAKSLFTFCQLNGIVINITHDFLNGLKLEPMNMRIKTGGIATTLTIEEDWYSAISRTDLKRLFDLSISLLFLVFVGSWLFPIIALLIKLESQGPVFFTQKRTGLNNTEFTCYKFRTMRVNSESDSRQATANDSRITTLGRLLRMSNIDELPQLLNVVLGHMSIVGPRPHMLQHTQKYGEMVNQYHERLWIKPGITGLSQSLGYRGEIIDFSQLAGRVQYDREYIREWSLLLDMKIIFSTAWNMVTFQKTGA